MASTDARANPTKNTAWRVTFPIYDNDGDLVVSAAGLDSEISKDGGTFADCTNEATQIATSSGMYYLDLTATEMNADTVAILIKTSTTDAKTTAIVVYPTTLSVAQLGVNIVNAGGTAWGSGAITAGSIASSAITSAKIATGAITATGIAASAIGATQLASNAITSAKVATDAIGSAQLAQAAADKVWSTTTRQLTAAQTFDLTGSVSGSVGSVTGSVGSVVGHTAQTGDSYARLGAPAGASVSADVAAVKSDSAAILTDTAEIGAAGAGLTALPWNAAWDAEVQSEVVDGLQEVVPDSIPADGSRPNIQQAAYIITQALTEFAISGTTVTVKKPDGSTTLFTCTLDSASAPTSSTRAT